MPDHIVRGARTDLEKIVRARELRATMTPGETALWRNLRGNRLGGLHFRRQQIIAGFIVDFYCHAAGVVVEVDGPIHAQQIEADQTRDGILTDCGFHVIRFKEEDVLNATSAVLDTIKTVCRDKINLSTQ